MPLEDTGKRKYKLEYCNYFKLNTYITCIAWKPNFLSPTATRDSFFSDEQSDEGKKSSRVGRGDRKCFPAIQDIIFFNFEVQKARNIPYYSISNSGNSPES